MEQYGLPVTVAEVDRYLSEVTELDPSGDPEVPIDQIADALVGWGLLPGEAVLILLPNGTSLLRYFFAVLAAGGVPTLLAPGTPSARVRQLAERISARVVISQPQAPMMRSAQRRRIGAMDVLLMSDAPVSSYEPGDAIVLTSGTSGVLSGCRHRLSSLVRNARRHADSVGLLASDTVLVNLPMHFSYALVAQVLASLVTGARLVVTGPPFTHKAYSSAIADQQVTSSSLTPFMVRALLVDGWKPADSLRMLTIGGDSLDPHLVALVLDRGPGMELYVTYGLTEAGPRVSTLAAHLEPPHRHASVGRPLDGVTVSLRDTDEHGTGELLVAADTVLRAKVGIEEGRAPNCLVAPGQIATGDLFRIDDDGYLYFQGRLSDFIVLRGSKIALASIRRIVNSLPGVAGSATSSYRGDDGETKLDLVVFMHDLSPEAAEQVKRALFGQLLRSERPDRITVRPVSERGHK